MATIIHPTARISKNCIIDVSVRGTDTIISEGVVIDCFVKIKHVGGTGNVVIGKNVYINSGTVIYSGNGVIINDDVLIGPNCSIVPVNHFFKNIDLPIRLQGFMPSKGGVIIHKDVWIGAGVTILDGVVIGEGCIIGANSLLTKNSLPYQIYAGNPAKVIGSRK